MPNLLQKASIVLTPTAYDDGKVLCAKPSEPPYGDFDFSRNSAATRVNAQGLVENVQILSGNLVQNGDFSEIGAEEISNGSFSQEGVELITNGSFDTDSNWTLSSGITYNSNGYIDFDGTQGTGQARNTPNIIFVQGKTYKVVYEIKNYVSGTIKFRFQTGANTIGQQVNGDGVKTEYIVCNDSSNNNFQFFNSPDFIGSIDNVSVKEVGQDWTFGVAWSVGEDKAIYDNSANSILNQSFTWEVGKTYKITFDIGDFTTSQRFDIYSGVSYIKSATIESDTSYTIYFNGDGGNAFRFRGFTTESFSVTNISVKEVGQNWDLGTGWSIGEDKAISDATQGYIVQTDVGGAGVTATYKIQWVQNITAGTRLRFFARNYNDGGNATILSITRDDGLIIGGGNCIGSGTFTAYVSSTNGYSFKLLAENGVEADITNITTIQITTDTNLPRINYEGFSYQDALGSELVDYSTLTSGSSSWSLVDGLWVFDDTANGFLNTPNIAVVVGDKYKVVVDVTISSGNANFRVASGNSQTLLFNYTDFVDGVNEFEATVTGVDGVLSRIFAPSSLTDNPFTLNSISIKKINGQEVVPDSGCGHWLWEPQSTNTVNNSNFTGAMGYHGGLIRSNDAAISPDSTFNAMSFIPTATQGVHRTGYSLTAGSYSQNDIVTFSCFVKANGYNFVTVGGFFGQEKAVFNISNGTLVSQESNVINTEIVKLTNDWYRLSTTYTFQNSIGNGYLYAGIYVMETETGYAFTGDGVSGVYGYGFQAELGTGTSYIPTEGTSVTRNQDVCTNGGSLASINSTEGVLYAEIAALSDDGTARIISLSQDGNTDNRINIFYTSGSNKMKFTVRVNNSNVFDDTITLSNILDYNKVALKYKENSFSIYINGVKEQEQLSGSAYPANTLNKLNFNQGGSNYDFFGKTKAVAVWKEALSDEELTELTTI